MSEDNRRIDPRMRHGSRGSDRYDERGGAGRNGNGGKMRLSGNESRRYDDREPYGGMRERDDRRDGRDGGPRRGYGGQDGEMQQRERDRDRQRRHDDQWQCDGRRGRDMRDGGWHGGQGGGWRDERSGGQGRNDNGGGGYDGGWQQDHDEEWRQNMYTHDGRGGGSGRRHGDPRYEHRDNGGGVSFSVETQGPARVGFRMGGSSMEHPDAERERERRRRQAEEEERAAAHREQSAPEPTRGERGQTQSDMWTGPVPQGASDDAVEVQRERIRGLIFRASAANQGLFGKLEDNLMTKVWGYVEMDVWTYAGVLAVVKERPRWWTTLAETSTTLGALKRCGHRTMQEHPVGKLVVRAATYGWLPRLARDVDEQDYAELSGEFKTMVRRGEIGTVGKRADKVMNQFGSLLRPGMETRFGRAAPAIALLREAVERGWKLKLARDVAAMVGAAADSDDDDDMPDMS